MYQVVDERRLKEILKFVGSYQTKMKLTDEDIERMKKQHRKIPDNKILIINHKLNQ